MITWHKKDYGFHLLYSGVITVEEMTDWAEGIKSAVDEVEGGFYVFVDMRATEILPADCKDLVEELQTYCKDNGMIRSVVILNDDITAMQFRIIAKKTGISQWERYIFSFDNPDWEQMGMDWLLHAIDPDKKYLPAT